MRDLPGDAPLTPDELAMIEADPGMDLLSETDKEGAPADSFGVAGVNSGEQDDPIADGVDADRAVRWAVFDTVTHAYVEASVRTRPPTDKMRSDLDRVNAEDGSDRFVWHRV